jgi:two-component system phosphate regulon sensor histidine kinase PhoR
MKRNQIRFIVLLGTLSILGIILIQIYFLSNIWGIKEREFNQTVNIALRSVAERLSDYNQTMLPHGNPVKQMSSHYFVVSVNDVIDTNVLEYFLQTEFEKHNIVLDYEYAIYNCDTDQMEFGKLIKKGETPKPIVFSSDLPHYDVCVYCFGVNFPSKKDYIIGDMTAWMVVSVILLLAIVFFGYAMFVILKQKRLSELQKDFINNMTHEFKTPISSINISADVLSSSEIASQPERLVLYSQIIKQENNRLNNLVEKVLQIAKIEKGGVELKFEQVDLNPLVEEVVETFRAKNGSNYECRIESALDPDISTIKADPLHLTNVLHNLLDNALKYGGPSTIVRVFTKMINGRITIGVEDNGPGIKPEHQKKVFQKFYRVPTGNVHNVKGFGLGLFYVKKVCTAHKWKVYLRSEEDKGTTFIIEA